MLLVMLAITGLTAVAAVAIVGHNQSVLASHNARAIRGSSPVDQAERILAQRYAKGEITAEEYDRMLIILRR